MTRARGYGSPRLSSSVNWYAFEISEGGDKVYVRFSKDWLSPVRPRISARPHTGCAFF